MKKLQDVLIESSIFTVLYVIALCLVLFLGSHPILNLLLAVLDLAGAMVALHFTRRLVEVGFLEKPDYGKLRWGTRGIVIMSLLAFVIHSTLVITAAPSRLFPFVPVVILFVSLVAFLVDRFTKAWANQK